MIQLSPKELTNFISGELKAGLIKFTANPKIKNLISSNKSHLTQKEITYFFDVSLNCIKKNIQKPFKVGQRACFKKSYLLDVLFT